MRLVVKVGDADGVGRIAAQAMRGRSVTRVIAMRPSARFPSTPSPRRHSCRRRSPRAARSRGRTACGRTTARRRTLPPDRRRPRPTRARGRRAGSADAGTTAPPSNAHSCARLYWPLREVASSALRLQRIGGGVGAHAACVPQSGILSCFFHGFSSCLSRSLPQAQRDPPPGRMRHDHLVDEALARRHERVGEALFIFGGVLGDLLGRLVRGR